MLRLKASANMADIIDTVLASTNKHTASLLLKRKKICFFLASPLSLSLENPCRQNSSLSRTPTTFLFLIFGLVVSYFNGLKVTVAGRQAISGKLFRRT
jgi:hypothetical protein